MQNIMIANIGLLSDKDANISVSGIKPPYFSSVNLSTNTMSSTKPAITISSGGIVTVI